jgi:thymidine kinase
MISIPSLYSDDCFKEKAQSIVKCLHSEERDAEKTLRLRFDIVSKWKEIGADFQTNCVFVDEAGFNTHMIRGRAWSKVGELANVTVHKQRGANISIVGYIA